jgi:hypothetical protein
VKGTETALIGLIGLTAVAGAFAGLFAGALVLTIGANLLGVRNTDNNDR